MNKAGTWIAFFCPSSLRGMFAASRRCGRYKIAFVPSMPGQYGIVSMNYRCHRLKNSRRRQDNASPVCILGS
jgi:hypothetical protein